MVRFPRWCGSACHSATGEPKFCPNQEFGNPVWMKWSVAELPSLGANAEVGPRESARSCPALHRPDPRGLFTCCSARARGVCAGAAMSTSCPLPVNSRLNFGLPQLLLCQKNSEEESPQSSGRGCSREHKPFHSSKALPYKGTEDILSVRHRREDAQILKFFSAPDLH